MVAPRLVRKYGSVSSPFAGVRRPKAFLMNWILCDATHWTRGPDGRTHAAMRNSCTLTFAGRYSPGPSTSRSCGPHTYTAFQVGHVVQRVNPTSTAPSFFRFDMLPSDPTELVYDLMLITELEIQTSK